MEKLRVSLRRSLYRYLNESDEILGLAKSAENFNLGGLEL